MGAILRIRLTAALVALTLVLLVKVSCSVVIDRLERGADATAEERVGRAVSVATASVNRLLLQVDGTLASLPDLLRAVARDGALAPEDAARALRTLAFQNLNFRDLLLVTADGAVWASARPGASGRPSPIAAAILRDGGRALSIAGPERNAATGEWAVYLVRMILVPGLGRVSAAAEVPLSLVTPLLAPAAEAAPGLRLSIERGDGTLLARFPHDEGRIGQRPTLSPTTESGEAGVRRAAEPGGVLSERQSLYRGILVIAGLDADAVLATARMDRERTIVTGVVAAVVIAILAVVLVLLIEQRARAAAERQRARRTLESAIEAMSDGFVLFDAKDHLVACNSRYRELYAVSADVIVPGATLEHILREGWRRGQYPEAGPDVDDFVRKTIAWHRGDSPPMERLLPDGRWLRISERRMPDGGVVGIRTDITDLKRAMEERAAGERRYAALARAGAAATWLALPDGTLLEAPGWEGLTGRTADLLLATGWAGVIHPDEIHLVEGWAALGAEGGVLDVEVRVPSDRGWLWVRLRGVPVLDPHTGQPTEWVGTVHDVHARRSAQEGLVESEARFARAVAAVGMGTWEWDPRTDALRHSPGFEALHGAAEGSLTRATDLLPLADPRDGTMMTFALSQARRGEGIDVEFRVGAPATGVRWLRMQGRPSPGGAGQLAGVTQDVTEKREAEVRLAHLARHDALTGLPNRAELHARLAEAVTTAGQTGGQMAVLYMDLDRFKVVNDTLGHPVGDALLRAATARILAKVRTGREVCDVVARLGGDEFVVLVAPKAGVVCDAAAEAAAIGRRLIEVLSQPFEVEEHQVVVGASVGVALYPHDGTTPDALLKNADLALYRAKEEGRGRVRFFEQAMDERAQERRLLELDLRRAVASAPDEFELYYQPVVDVVTRRPTGFEALMRWRHPQRGLVPPSDFIPLAEDVGLIVELGELALHRACTEAAGWPAGLRVAVNLSPAQFRNPRIVETVSEALLVAGLPARRLELEITEGVLLQGTEATIMTLHRLRDLGVRIAMDDFGTGYSSLSYLRSFPFDKVKIDRAFVQGLAERSNDAAIVQAVTGLCDRLGMTSTAEGVETEEQLQLLASERCTEVQGYLFSRPVPASEVPVVLNRLGVVPSDLAPALDVP